MPQGDLQTYLNSLDPSQYKIIDREAPRDGFLSSLVLALEGEKKFPVIRLNQVEGADMPVVGNLFGARERIAHMAGATTENFYLKWHEAQDHMRPPVVASQGPVQDVVMTGEQVDITKLPAGIHFASDAGRYISSGITVAKDPDSGVYNLSYHRLQMKGPNRFGISLHSRGHLWDYFRRSQLAGKDLEIAVIIGCHPAVYLAAASRMGIQVDEYALAGGLLGEPLEMVRCQTVDLLVPAAAEIVLEGKILADTYEDEGPFGEYTGYSTSRSTRNVMDVTAMCQKKDPVFLDLVPGYSSEHLLLGGAAKEAELLYLMKDRFPTIQDIYFPKSGAHFHAYIKMKKTAEGQPKQAMTLLTGLDMYLKLIITVDEDVDIYNDEQILWALATRMQPDEDVLILPGLMCNALDPSTKNGLSAKMMIDATLPLDGQAAQCKENEQIRTLARAMAKEL